MSATPQRYSLHAIRKELARVGQVLMGANEKFMAREAELNEQLKGSPDRQRLMETDKRLRDASAVAKTCAALATGLSAVIVGEVAYREEARRNRAPGQKVPYEPAV